VTTTPFDALASQYDALWTASSEGHAQRQAVWREIGGLFRHGDRVLELGCGTGEDAVRLKMRGIKVYAIDASAEMVARSRAKGVVARHLRIEELAQVGGLFDGVLSDFGALNCVADLNPVARELARLVRPGGRVALCLLARWHWPEFRRYALRFEFAKAVRRWSGRKQWRGITIYYPSSRKIVDAFDHAFQLERKVSIGKGDHQLYIFTRRCPS
jgi:SAM-dependent methyltransferase